MEDQRNKHGSGAKLNSAQGDENQLEKEKDDENGSPEDVPINEQDEFVCGHCQWKFPDMESYNNHVTNGNFRKIC